MYKSVNGDYMFTHYVDMKQGSVVHLLVVDGIITESHFRDDRLNALVKNKTILEATKALVIKGQIRKLVIKKV